MIHARMEDVFFNQELKELNAIITLANTLKDMVAELPLMDNLNLSWDKAITQLRDIYDGMTSYQQQFVSEDALKTLHEYETRMEELRKVAEQSETVVTE